MSGHARFQWLVASALLFVLFGGCRAQSRQAPASTAAPRAVVLTTDCGVEMDDQWALAHLLLSAELDLRAVITTHAATVRFSSATSAQKARDVISRVPRPGAPGHLPVVQGSDAPLPDGHTPQSNAGIDLLLRVSRDFSEPHRLVVLAIGAATDVASAILTDPSIVDRIIVVAMGFDDWPQGGDVFNVKNDPRAWDVILGARVPLVIGSSAVARRGLRLTRIEAAALMQPHGELGRYLYSLFDDWLKREPQLVAQAVAPETWVVWDEVVVAYLLGLTGGDDVPRPQLRPDLSFAHPATSDRITWLSRIETERFWRDFTGKIDASSGAGRKPRAPSREPDVQLPNASTPALAH